MSKFKKVDVEKVVAITAKIPWGDVMKLVGKLMSYSRGGINKEEATDLAKDLIKLAAEINGQVISCEGKKDV